MAGIRSQNSFYGGTDGLEQTLLHIRNNLVRSIAYSGTTSCVVAVNNIIS